MEVLTKKHKNKEIIFGSYEEIDKNEWYWTCFDAKMEELDGIFSQGCATSEDDCIIEINSEWNYQLNL
jgi:hypothetical protein